MAADAKFELAYASRGALLLRDFLRYAEHGRLESTIASAQAGAESPFEARVTPDGSSAVLSRAGRFVCELSFPRVATAW